MHVREAGGGFETITPSPKPMPIMLVRGAGGVDCATSMLYIASTSHPTCTLSDCAIPTPQFMGMHALTMLLSILLLPVTLLDRQWCTLVTRMPVHP